ncbi:MAG: polar amino acid transport system substrate-binding protein, partial [Flavobacteriales bacterium]
MAIIIAQDGIASDDTKPAKVPDTLILSATDWCPYSCFDSKGQPGIVHEYIRMVLKKHGHILQVNYHPWSRAIREATEGRSHGLMAAIPEETPSLVFTAQAFSHYTDCFVTRLESDWQYTGAESLHDLRLGVVNSYSYSDEVDDYILNGGDKVQALSGDHAVLRFFKLLDARRIDAFIDDISVIKWEARKYQYSMREYRVAGCHAAKPLFVALHPKLPWIASFMALIDKESKNPESVNF